MITIIDYGMGNVGSIANMLKRIGADAEVSSDLQVIAKGSRLILPGVGAFDAGMASLQERGLIPVLDRRVRKDGVPILGLCLGMQLMTRRSDEGQRLGLGWLDAEAKRFNSSTLKVPHMGWNSVNPKQEHPLFQGLEVENRFYFVHSYYISCCDPDQILGETEYGFKFASAAAAANIAGVQFHPEKSHRFGMLFLQNFAAWSPP